MLLKIQSNTRAILEKICLWLGYFGGIAMCSAILVIVTSISLGIFGAPILGDSEIVELLMGVAIFSFLPYCHLHHGNIVVDFFAKMFPQWANDFLDVVMNIGFAVVGGFIMYQTMQGASSAISRDWHSMFLQLPKWPVYMIASGALALWVLVIVFATYEAALRMVGLLEKRDEGAEFS